MPRVGTSGSDQTRRVIATLADKVEEVDGPRGRLLFLAGVMLIVDDTAPEDEKVATLRHLLRDTSRALTRH